MLKNLGLISAFFVFLFLFAKFGPAIPFTVSQVTTNKSEPFSVSADGKVFAKPDIAEISLGFTNSASTVSQVQTSANQTVNNISAAVKRLGIADGDIKTTNYNLRPDYDWNAKPQRITGYNIDVNLSVRVRDFAKINQVIDAGTANGANLVGNLNFTFDDVEKFKSQARKLAIDNAKKKASEISGASGISLGRLINVTEGNVYYPQPLMMAKDAVGMAGGGAAPTKVEPGTSEVSVTVTLSYETR